MFAIKNTIFRHNITSIFSNVNSQHLDVQNSLFVGNSETALVFKSVNTSDLDVVGCTFDDNAKAIDFYYDVQGLTICNAVIEDNVFGNNGTDVECNDDPDLTIHDVSRNNLFWNNEKHNLNDALNLSDPTNLMDTNPLFVHRSRSSEGNIVENWQTDKDFTFDGYYLSQRTGDASRRPFILRNDQLLATQNGIDLSDTVQGGYGCVYVLTDDGSGLGETYSTSNRGRCSFYYSNYYYTRGTQTTPGPLTIIFCSGGISMTDNPSLTLNFADGMQLKVWLPALGYLSSGSKMTFWVAEDGSTYYAHTGKAPVYDHPYWNMDAYYALRWFSSNLARSAYDAGGKSPAIDAGSKDFLNGGVTRTQYESLEEDNLIMPAENTEDNPPPEYRDDFDNQHWDWNNHIDEALSWEDPGSNTYGTKDDLDIGYHYWGACYHKLYGTVHRFTRDPNEAETVVTLRHPKEASVEIKYTVGEEELIFRPEITSPEHIAVASSEYNGQEKTIACFRTNRVNDQSDDAHCLVCYNRFRGGSGSQGVICDFLAIGSYTAHISNLFMTTGSGASGSMEKPIYLAINVLWGTVPADLRASQVKVYRYEPGDQDDWVLVGDHFFNAPDQYTYFKDVALAADGDDVVVFWIRRELSQEDEFWGYRIENAAWESTATDFYEVEEPFLSFQTATDMMNADWDPDDWINAPRITWTDWEDGKYKTWAAQVTFLGGQPDDITQRKLISDEGADSAKNPSIAVNHPQFDLDNPYEAFASFTCGRSILRSDLQSSGGNDTWTLEDSLASGPDVYEGETCVTYRAFGTPLNIWEQDDELYTDREIIPTRWGPNPKGVKLCTNRHNQTDIFTTYARYSGLGNTKIMVQQLEP